MRVAPPLTPSVGDGADDGPTPVSLGRIVSVLPDLSGLDRVFSYLVPAALSPDVALGSIVRVPLGARRVRGWVVAEAQAEEESARESLRPVESVVSLGPSPEVVALAEFGAWRYAGRLRPFLAAGSPERRVSYPAEAHGGAGRPLGGREPGALDGAVAEASRAALAQRHAVLRLPPMAARLPVVLTALDGLAEGSDLLVLVPARRDATVLTERLRALGLAVAPYPAAFAEARAGGRIVVGTRRAAFASLALLGALVVLDAHDEAYVEERAPTWNATVIAAERARRAGVPLLYASAVPPLELTESAEVIVLPGALERLGWPALQVLDRRGDDPRSGLYAPDLGEVIRAASRAAPELPVVCVLNRTGRARLLACAACGALVTCEHCGGALGEEPVTSAEAPRRLVCVRCGLERPRVCAACDSSRLKALRVGVTRVAEELAALVNLPVTEVSGPDGDPPEVAPVMVGTEAVLHRVRRASLVVFLDFDQELLAPRLRAPEQALALIARAGRLLGTRTAAASGFAPRVVVQTRLVDHVVLEAARAGDPGVLAAAERARRRSLSLPPFGALALLTGPDAALLAERAPADFERAGLGPQRHLVRAADHTQLADGLRAAQRPEDDVRIEVDPLRL